MPQNDTKPDFDKSIAQCLAAMSQLHPGSKEYADILETVSKLNKMRAEDQPQKVSPDTVWKVGGSLAGIYLITWFERHNVITTKALGFIPKML